MFDDGVLVQDDVQVKAYCRVIEALDGRVFRENGMENTANTAIDLIVGTLASKGWDRAAALQIIVDGDITGRDSRCDAEHFDLVVKRPGNGPAVVGIRMMKSLISTEDAENSAEKPEDSGELLENSAEKPLDSAESLENRIEKLEDSTEKPADSADWLDSTGWLEDSGDWLGVDSERLQLANAD